MDHSQQTNLDNSPVSALYRALLSAWNQREGGSFAGLFAENGSTVGFDGSMMNGQGEIERELNRVFRDHMTSAYVGIIREVRFISADCALLRAVAGMVPPGQQRTNPAVNSIQSLVAIRQGGEWRIALFQNTPAQFHGRPELAEQLTAELDAEAINQR